MKAGSQSALPVSTRNSPEDVQARRDKAERVKNYLLTLSRRAEVESTASETIALILGDRIADYWQPAFEAAMTAAEHFDIAEVHPVIDEVIARSLREKPDLNLAAELYNKIPLNTLLLTQTGVEVFRQTVKAMEDRGRIELHPAEYLTMVLNLAGRLAQIGEFVEAENTAKKAIEFSRARYRKEPETFHLALASSLEAWAIASFELGHNQESHKAREEAIALLRSVPGRERDLAQSLNNQSGTLRALGDNTAALRVSEEAVAIYRDVVTRSKAIEHTHYPGGLDAWLADPRPNLADALIALSSHQDVANKHQECLASAKQAFDIFFTLNEDYPDQFLGHFGMAKHNLGMAKFGVGDASGGLRDMQDAATVFANLVKVRPRTFEPMYAQTLDSLARAYVKNDRIPESLPPSEACVALYRKINLETSGRYIKQLKTNLANLRDIYEAVGRDQDARQVSNEIDALTGSAHEEADSH